MSLCIRCGKILEHARGCADAPQDGASRNDRTLRVLQESQAKEKEIADLAASDPRGAGKALFLIETALEKHPASDLTSFGHKREYQALDGALKKHHGNIEGAAGAQLFLDLAFAKKGLELLHAAILARREGMSFKLDHLAQIPGLGFDASSVDPTDPASGLNAAADAIDRRLKETAGIDAEVDRWGKPYIEALGTGTPPPSFPAWAVGGSLAPKFAIIAGGVVLAVLGVATMSAGAPHVGSAAASAGPVLIGAGGLVFVLGIVLFLKALAAAKAAPDLFLELSKRFRERLYLVCALRSLRAALSSLSKAEEALRSHTSGTENAARWKRIKTQERDLVKALAGENWDEAHQVDEEMTRRLQAGGVARAEAFRPLEKLSRDDWDGIAKAYTIERSDESDDADEARLATLASLVLTEPSPNTAKALSDVRAVFSGQKRKNTTSERPAAEI